jgi:hypothetical protein
MHPPLSSKMGEKGGGGGGGRRREHWVPLLLRGSVTFCNLKFFSKIWVTNEKAPIEFSAFFMVKKFKKFG